MEDNNKILQDDVEEDLEEEIELEDISIEDIEFDNKTLLYWEEQLTVSLPPLPTDIQNIKKCLADIVNKYQIAYNCYNKLLVLSSQAERQYRRELEVQLSDIIKGYSEKKVTKLPSKETLESIALSKSKKLKLLNERLSIYKIIEIFFENSKTKLEKIIKPASDIAYSTSQSDKAYTVAAR